MFEASEALQEMEGMKKIKSTSFHQYSWNSEVEAKWISLIGWHHKTSIKYVSYMLFKNHALKLHLEKNVFKIIFRYFFPDWSTQTLIKDWYKSLALINLLNILIFNFHTSANICLGITQPFGIFPIIYQNFIILFLCII